VVGVHIHAAVQQMPRLKLLDVSACRKLTSDFVDPDFRILQPSEGLGPGTPFLPAYSIAWWVVLNRNEQKLLRRVKLCEQSSIKRLLQQATPQVSRGHANGCCRNSEPILAENEASYFDWFAKIRRSYNLRFDDSSLSSGFWLRHLLSVPFWTKICLFWRG